MADTLDAAALAARYGWAAAVLNSDPALAAVFRTAVEQQWTADRFTAELRSTPWFQQRSESARQAEAQRLSDPATYNQRVSQMTTSVMQQAAQSGAALTDAQAKQIAANAVQFGWTENDVAPVLSQYVTYKNGALSGTAGQVEDQLRKYAYANGVRVDESWVLKASQAVVGGKANPDQFMDQIRGWAVSAFPTLAPQLKAGMTVADVASPYRQSMAALLETPADKIDVFDPSIRKALTGVGKDGQPAVTPLWKFEQEVRKDPRWMKTGNARESLVSSTRQVLNDFGFGA